MKNPTCVTRFARVVIGLAALAATGPTACVYGVNRNILGCADYCSSIDRPASTSGGFQ